MAENQETSELPFGVAIVGLSCRVPGARSAAEYWRNLLDGHEALQEYAEEELLANGVPPTLLADPAYVRKGMPLAGLAAFDAGFFGLSSLDAAVMDPQHRHFLECTWEALEDSGYDPATVEGAIGVFAGVGAGSYFARNILRNERLLQDVGYFLLRHTGNDKDFLPTRASYQFDLEGPSIGVQTACSTSLVAVHLAATSLLARECDMALAGGVTIEVPHRQGYLFHEGEILSPDGHCRPFDAASKGTVFGSGVALVALKRLEDAVADRDTIHAVIRGSAINNDGAQKVSYLAPSVDGQVGAAAEALALADVEPESVAFIECHGTGTQMGDPIEVAALREAYGPEAGARHGGCWLGSVKSNIGHLDTAAGTAGLIKAALALRHRKLPPTLHFSALNPEIAAPDLPFDVNAATVELGRAAPLRAAVNSLGVGGTNAHVVLEEGPRPAPAPASRTPQVLALSARTDTSLARLAERMADHVEGLDPAALPDAAWTLQVGRRAFAKRRAIVATAPAEAAEKLRAVTRSTRASVAPDAPPGVAMAFAGGGASYPGMGYGLYRGEPVYREAVDEAIAAAPAHVADALRDALTRPDGSSREAMRRPLLGLPALFAVQHGCTRLWGSLGIRPSALIGHSVGEYAAACAAGVFSVADAMRIVVRRGELFETLPAGAMLSVAESPESLREVLGNGVEIGVLNAPELTVLSGPSAAIDAAGKQLAGRGIEAQRLHIDVAAHSAMLEPILAPFREALASIEMHAPTIPVASNLTGEWLTDEEATSPAYWVDQLRRTVRFSEGMNRILRDHPVILEVGPGTAMTALARANAPAGAPPVAVSSMRDPKDAEDDSVRFAEAFGSLWAGGVPVAWAKLHGDDERRRVPLPTYAFDHQEYWIEESRSPPARERSPVDAWGWVPAWSEAPPARGVPDAPLLAIGEDPGPIRALLADAAPVESFSVSNAATVREPTGVLVTLVDAGEDRPEDLEAALARLVACAQRIGNLASGAATWVVLVRAAATLPFGAERPSPVASGIVSATRVLARELAPTKVRCIDIGPGETDPASLLAELTADDIPFVALRGQRRLKLDFAPAGPVREAPVPPAGPVLLSGGLGDLALALAEDLVERGVRRLALMARRPLPEGAARAFHASAGGRTADRLAAIQRLEAAGADIRIVVADVADPAAVTAAIAGLETAWGPLELVIHTAGVMDDGLVDQKTPDGIAAVLRPKAAGAMNLVSACAARAIFFSSTSAVVGLPGQVDYAAANGFLDGLAARLRREGAPVTSVGWGAWRDIGMAARRVGGGPAHRSPVTERRRRRDGALDVIVDGRDWPVAEHRTRSGTSLLPGTGFLALLLAAVDPGREALVDVTLLEPLVLDAADRVVLRVARKEDEFTVESAADADRADRGAWLAEHVGGAVAPRRRTAPSLDPAELRTRCARSIPVEARRVPHHQMDFGARWSCVDEIRIGDGEALVAASLASEYAGDLADWPLHPALLDVLLGAGHHLVPDFDPEIEFLVPHGYGRVELHGAPSDRLLSRIQRAAVTREECVFDVVVVNEAGAAVLVLEGFRMRRMDPAVLDRLGDGASARGGDALRASWLETGIARSEATPWFRALDPAGLPPHLLITPEPPERLLAAAAALGEPDAADGPLVMASRPETSADYAAPTTETELGLARMWGEALGIDGIGLHDDFFELGGHSLLLTKLAKQARKLLGGALPIGDLFRAPTIAGWIEAANAGEPAEVPAIAALTRIAREDFSVDS